MLRGVYTEMRPGPCPPPLSEEGSAVWVTPEGPGEGPWEQAVAAEKLVRSWGPAHRGLGELASEARVCTQPCASSAWGTEPFPGYKCHHSEGCGEDENISGVGRLKVFPILWPCFNLWVSSLHQILVRLYKSKSSLLVSMRYS